jgi:hypothetical protein
MGYEAYHWTGAEYIQNALAQTVLKGRQLPMPSCDKNRTRKRKTKTRTTARKMTMMTTKTTATRNKRGLVYFSGEG